VLGGRLQRFARPAAVAATLAALPQLIGYAGQVRSGDYPGSAYAPRVSTLVAMSTSAAEGGPFAAVREKDGWHLAAVVVPDLGMPALMDLSARLHGRPATEATLGLIHLVFLCAALFGLVFAFPERLRWGLVPVFLLLPVSVPEYRSPDTVALHGALAALAVVAAAVVARGGPVWAAAPVGILLFVLGKVRSVYGTYALVALVLVAVAVTLRMRDRRVLARAAAALAVLAVLELMWVPVVRARANDPRVVDRGMITSHDLYAALLSGVGFSPNRWGLEAADPRVVLFIARRLDLSVMPRLFTEEGQAQARRAYWSLWGEDPLHLLRLYVRRFGGGIADYMVMGRWGAPFWVAAVGTAAVVTWRRRDGHGLAAVLAAAALTLCLLAQVAVVDPRFIYAYPLRFMSALALATAGVVLVSGSGRLVEVAAPEVFARFRHRHPGKGEEGDEVRHRHEAVGDVGKGPDGGQ
jgi:hypothetical protein